MSHVTDNGVVEEAMHTLSLAKPRLLSASTTLQCSQTAKEHSKPILLTDKPL